MRISRNIYDEVVGHALSDRPYECCGMLGRIDNELVSIHRATNVGHSSHSFAMDPHEQEQIFDLIAGAGQELGAIYHSHTEIAPEMSRTDLRFAQWWPGVVWIIVGLAGDDPVIKAWAVEDQSAVEAPLDVVPSSTSQKHRATPAS